MSTKNTQINKKIVITGLIIEALLIAAIIFSIFYVDPTYQGYVAKGQEQLKEKEYGKAVESFDKALEIDPSGIDALIGQADGYMGMKEFKKAIPQLNKAKGLDGNNALIYDKLITSYVKTDDIEDANAVIMEAYEAGLPSGQLTAVSPAPSISPLSGTYGKAIKVKIKSESDDSDNNASADKDSKEEKIYYTTDGTVPTLDSKEYKSPLTVNKSGKYKVVATIIKDNGLIGYPATVDYTVNIKTPAKLNLDKYIGKWTDGETTLTITETSGDKVKFNIKLNWVDETIKTSTSGTYKDGVLNFTYTDNWGNKGKGLLRFGNDVIGFKIEETDTTGATTPGFGNYSAALHRL